MSDSAQLTPSKAANTILRWIRVASGEAAAFTDLDMVREGLPGTPYGEGVKIIKPPMASPIKSSEGMLVCNPDDPTEWGIFVNEDSSPERRRFTIAHELGHFVLHRAKRRTFNCDKAAVHLSLESAGVIEREADEFASNLLMLAYVKRIGGYFQRAGTYGPDNTKPDVHYETQERLMTLDEITTEALRPDQTKATQ